MSTQMTFVSLPVTDLPTALHEAAGFRMDPPFRDDTATCSMHSRGQAGALPMDPAAIPSSDGRAP